MNAVAFSLLSVLTLFGSIQASDFYAPLAEKAERNKIDDFIAVASVSIDYDRPLSESPLLRQMVGELHFLVIPGGDTTLGVSTLWCCPEDYSEAAAWLKREWKRFPEVNGLIDDERYYFDRREREDGGEKR